MDRDKRWERVQRGYDLMTLGVGTRDEGPARRRVRRFYEQNVTDEFIEPISVLTPEGAHLGRIEDGDCGHLLQLPRGPDAPDRHRIQGR